MSIDNKGPNIPFISDIENPVIRAIVFVIVIPFIAVGVFLLFSMIFGPLLALLAFVAVMGGGTWIFLHDYIRSRLEADSSQVKNTAVKNLFVIIVALAIYSQLLTWYTQTQAIAIVIFVFGSLSSILWFFAGRADRIDLEQKKQKERQYIESLDNAASKCQSCMKKIGDSSICPHCGFEQKK